MFECSQHLSRNIALPSPFLFGKKRHKHFAHPPSHATRHQSWQQSSNVRAWCRERSFRSPSSRALVMNSATNTLRELNTMIGATVE